MRQARAQDGLVQRREGRHRSVRFPSCCPALDFPVADDDTVKFLGGAGVNLILGVTRALDITQRFVLLLFWPARRRAGFRVLMIAMVTKTQTHHNTTVLVRSLSSFLSF